MTPKQVLKVLAALMDESAFELSGGSFCPAVSATPQTERAVIVTTEQRGVFFGYATDKSGETIKLRAARNCIYWSAKTKGFLGLATTGPAEGSRVGPPADIELRNITCVAEATDAAVKVWEAAPWAL
jgi:hypothetical protein